MDDQRSGAVRASYLVSEALLEAADPESFRARARGRSTPRVRAPQISLGCTRIGVAPDARRRHLHPRPPGNQPHGRAARRCDAAFYFLDLEDFRRGATACRSDAGSLNLVHLDRSIGSFVSRAGRLDFLYAYLGSKLDRAATPESARGVSANAQAHRRTRTSPPRLATATCVPNEFYGPRDSTDANTSITPNATSRQARIFAM